VPPPPTATDVPQPTDTSSPPADTPTSTPTETPTSTPTETPTPTTDPPPDAPTNLRAAAGDSKISLGWDDLTIEPDLAGYRVYSSTAPGGPFNLHASVAITDEYLDLSVINTVAYYYQVTALDTGSNESGPSNIASALPYSLAPYTFTTTINPCSGPTSCSAAAGQPDGGTLDLNAGEYFILDFGDGYGIVDGPSYDLVLYEYPSGGGILMDFITITISADGATWFTVFAWDNTPGGVFGTNIDSYAIDGDGEFENEPIPASSLYPPPSSPPNWNTGVAIDIGPWTPAGYSFRYVRLEDAGGGDDAQIDAVERLN
jgi:hypothetical protein